MSSRELGGFLVATLVGYALFELYLALRPDDLTGEIRRFLDSAPGRFETYYAERRRDGDRDRDSGPAADPHAG